MFKVWRAVLASQQVQGGAEIKLPGCFDVLYVICEVAQCVSAYVHVKDWW